MEAVEKVEVMTSMDQETLNKLLISEKFKVLKCLDKKRNLNELQCNKCSTVSAVYAKELVEGRPWCKCDTANNLNSIIQQVLDNMKLMYSTQYKLPTRVDLVFAFAIDFDDQRDSILIDIVSEKGPPERVSEATRGYRIIQIDKTYSESTLKIDLKAAIKTNEKSLYLSNNNEENNSPVAGSSMSEFNHSDGIENLIRRVADKDKLTRLGDHSAVYTEGPPSKKGTVVIRGYIRVSTQDQSSNGMSIKAQEELIRTYAKQHGHLYSLYFDCGISGKSADTRPALIQLRKDFKGGEKIVVANMSRLGRNNEEITQLKGEIKRRKAVVVALDINQTTATADGRFVISMVDAMSEYQREQISKTVSLTMGSYSAEGKLRGKTPYGYKLVLVEGQKDKKLIRNEDEQRIIEKVRAWKKEAPHLTVSAICKMLDEEPDPCRRKASRWYETTLVRIMQREGIPFTPYIPVVDKDEESTDSD